MIAVEGAPSRFKAFSLGDKFFDNHALREAVLPKRLEGDKRYDRLRRFFWNQPNFPTQLHRRKAHTCNIPSSLVLTSGPSPCPALEIVKSEGFLLSMSGNHRYQLDLPAV